MKYFFIFLLSILPICSFASINTPNDTNSFYGISDFISDAIRSGDAGKLSTFFAPTIQLSIPGKKGDFSKTQAEIIMRAFFVKYPPTTFSINAEGKTSGNNYYVLGSYISGEIKLKTYYVIQKQETEITLHILKFEIQ